MMKNKRIIFLLAGVLGLIIIGCCVLFTEPKSKEATIKIGDKVISGEHVRVYRNDAIMPMFQVLEAYDVSVEWLDENNAGISYDNVTLSLSLIRMELIDKQSGHDYFLPLPDGTNYYCEYLDGEIILDDETMHYILFQLGIRTEILIDYNKGEVVINRLQEE